jgi:hypothetical protein
MVLPGSMRRITVDENTLSRSKRKTAAEYKADVTDMLSEIGRLNEQMCKDQADIDRFKVETDALRLQTQQLRLETRAVLTRLGAIL